MVEIVYQTDLHAVDWAAMKTILRQDVFDNGRSPQQLKASFENSYAACVAYANRHIVGTARVLSDGVCNASLVDVWTLSAYRRQGIASEMVRTLLKQLAGQHVYLFTDDVPELYTKLGFTQQPVGMGQIVGTWLVNQT